jgi:hypothetical protein
MKRVRIAAASRTISRRFAVCSQNVTSPVTASKFWNRGLVSGVLVVASKDLIPADGPIFLMMKGADLGTFESHNSSRSSKCSKSLRKLGSRNRDESETPRLLRKSLRLTASFPRLPHSSLEMFAAATTMFCTVTQMRSPSVIGWLAGHVFRTAKARSSSSAATRIALHWNPTSSCSRSRSSGSIGDPWPGGWLMADTLEARCPRSPSLSPEKASRRSGRARHSADSSARRPPAPPSASRGLEQLPRIPVTLLQDSSAVQAEA